MVSALVLTLALAAPEDRPTWWRVPALQLKTDLEFTERPDGSVLLDKADADKLAGLLARAQEYAEIADLSLAQLWAYHGAVVAEVRAGGVLDAQEARAASTVEIESRWPTWHVALLAVGAAAAGIVVGGLLVLGATGGWERVVR